MNDTSPRQNGPMVPVTEDHWQNVYQTRSVNSGLSVPSNVPTSSVMPRRVVGACRWHTGYGCCTPTRGGRHSVVTSAGLVSLVWAAWHIPLFGITPSYRAMPIAGFLGFALSIWVASWIFAWLLHAGRESLMVVGITLVGLVLLTRLLKQPAPAPRDL